ncbi:MAG: D-glycero-beta-D-manno-heptose 1-phosphate adenylyltransferase [Candidatus Omnitrophica bacterium CG11_big_fil_rev_8_21_14_0_20_42_13]|uniref:D-glycero-beta-D-manno-heptose 1-phosphate adenylyltransferase n=1 Tax=Candidatus Ghiorseimicrobium undicola TaxID=1974746 RepID=A0A2H0LZU9_9BACT|nr:MAG: D-glycero-beta-D-manno-heptose 1-phosphate adenylyltransferase [Candidatus Omnitrophica bacterium CG11_big_fil_rev_8_21_14_0_20_42_13]
MPSKIKTLTQLKKITANLKRRGKKIVFTNGCFDILHYGHIKYLEKASKYGDILIIGLNSDSSIKRIKGSRRPLNPEKYRAYILSAISFIDYIVIFGQDTPYNLISALRPDILVKGGDWHKNKIVGSGIVKQYGGKVLTIPYVKNLSTTKILKKITAIG